jgi:hypothetical protein
LKTATAGPASGTPCERCASSIGAWPAEHCFASSRVRVYDARHPPLRIISHLERIMNQ